MSPDDFATRLEAAVERHLHGFREAYGYEPDLNYVRRRGSDGAAPFDRDLSFTVPRDVRQFFRAISEVSLPDVWNGYFLGPPDLAVDTWKAGQPDGRIVIGSDGGGALFVVAAKDQSPVLRLTHSSDASPVEVAATFDGFLARLLREVEAFVDEGTPPTL